MITSIQITGIAYEVNDATRKYVTKKIGQLDRYLPRHARKSVTAEVKLRQVNHDFGNKYQAEVILTMPGKVVTAKDSAINILAAIDIVEAKLHEQLREYKRRAIAHVGSRRILGRLKRGIIG